MLCVCADVACVPPPPPPPPPPPTPSPCPSAHPQTSTLPYTSPSPPLAPPHHPAHIFRRIMLCSNICNLLTAGHSESEYFDTPQASPSDHHSRHPGREERQAHDPSEARRGLNLAAPVQGNPSQDRHPHNPLRTSQHASDYNRDIANNDSFQTARSHASDDAHTENPGVLGSVLGAVGLGSRDHVEGSGATQTAPHTTSQSEDNTNTSGSNTGVLGSIKAAVGLGDNPTGATQHAQGGTGYDSSYTGSGKQAYGSGVDNQGSNTNSGAIRCWTNGLLLLLVLQVTSSQAMMWCITCCISREMLSRLRLSHMHHQRAMVPL